MHLLLGAPREGALTRAGHILVVGFGNSLCADDGVGPAAVARLRAEGLPAGLRAEDGGQDALGVGRLWDGEPEVWLVDALLRGGPPGAVHRLGHEEILSVPQRHATAHRLSLPECLRWLALGDGGLAAVRWRLWGIEPARLELAEGLSAQAERGVGIVVSEIRRRAFVRRPGPASPW